MAADRRRMTVTRTMILAIALLVLMAGCVSEAEPKAEPAETQPAPREPAPTAAAPAAPETPELPRVRVPAGKFTFGTTEEQFQYYVSHSLINFPGMVGKLRKTFVIPPRQIKLQEFAIDPFEVSNEQYRQFVKATGYKPASTTNYLKHWTGPDSYPNWAGTFPVVWISQEDAEAYCKWRGGRLPTEQEWEKAARGTDDRAFPWGNTYPAADTVNLAFGTGRAEPVGNRPDDKSPFGVYDMGGNVSEVTASTVKDGAQTLVVVRGGSFISGGRDAAVYRRTLFDPPSVRSETVGCRCVGGN